MKRLSLLFGVLLGVLACFGDARAHEVRPAYLEITETAPGRYDVLWRTPLLSGMRLPVVPRFPADVRDLTEPAVRELPDSLVERRVIEASEGLAGKRIELVGLQATITDVLVRVQTLDGAHTTTLVRPSRPWIEIATESGPLVLSSAYLIHGIEHILLGYDHLLFVLALVLIVRRGQALLWTITAFTVAHSITLSLAVLGVVHMPGPPVEACIALSILLLAGEIMQLRRGRPSLTGRWPWLVAFSFGLLHGFGFAGALTEIGLPRGDIPLALLAFNIGVEIGQLMFIGLALGALAFARHLGVPSMLRRLALTAATYGIGGVAAFWFVERLASFAA